MASRVNGEVVIPNDVAVNSDNIGAPLPPSGDLGGSAAAAAPAPAPSANLTLPAELAPDVNATWHLVDSPVGATCEVSCCSLYSGICW